MLQGYAVMRPNGVLVGVMWVGIFWKILQSVVGTFPMDGGGTETAVSVDEFRNESLRGGLIFNRIGGVHNERGRVVGHFAISPISTHLRCLNMDKKEPPLQA